MIFADKKRDSVWGYLSLMLAIIAIVVYLAAYFTEQEMAMYLVLSLAVAILGILLGLVGSVQRRFRKRMAVWGLVINILFILTVITLFVMWMGGA